MVLLSIAAGCEEDAVPVENRVIMGDPEEGRRIVAAVECGVCHEIPDMPGADGIVGPPLTGFGRRQFIAGVLPNRPDLLVRWVREAPTLISDTGMPDMPITEAQSRDVAAYLYSLR